MEEIPKLYTVKEVAELLKVTIYAIYDWIDQGKIKCYRIGTGRNLRISQNHIDEYLNSGTEKENE